MDEILAKLNTLRAKYPDQEDQMMLSDWEKDAKAAVLAANLQENDAIKSIIEKYKKEVATLNKGLSENEALFKDPEGMMLGRLMHERKKWCLAFLSIFTRAQTAVDTIKRTLDNRIEESNEGN